jgi:hypothetical protein
MEEILDQTHEQSRLCIIIQSPKYFCVRGGYIEGTLSVQNQIQDIKERP